MQTYIARQPIFDRYLRVAGYELLYRAGDGKNAAHITDGDRATRNLLSDAMMVFGLQNLTNGCPAYINFTEKLVMNDFVLLADPHQVTVELLEDIPVTEKLAKRLVELRRRGYCLALDDYTGDACYDPIIPLVDIIKVDFSLTDEATREKIAKKYRRSRVQLLAEKVEDRETYQRADKMGFSLFQGYFFEKPTQMNKKAPGVNSATYIQLLRELNEPDVDLEFCAQLIRADAVLTYRILKKVQTLQYYRGNSVQVIGQAVAYLGIDELYHWVVLSLARDYNASFSDEAVREAYLRGIFMERLLDRSPYRNKKTTGFLLGMFSLMERIMNRPLSELLENVELPKEIPEILIEHSENPLKEYLAFVESYERDQTTEIPKLSIDADEIVKLYMCCIQDTDRAFRGALQNRG